MPFYLILFVITLMMSAGVSWAAQDSIPGYLVLRELGTESSPLKFKKNALYFNWDNGSYAMGSDWPEEGSFLVYLDAPKLDFQWINLYTDDMPDWPLPESELIPIYAASNPKISEAQLFGDFKYGFGTELQAMDSNKDGLLNEFDESWDHLYLWAADAHIIPTLASVSDVQGNNIDLKSEKATINGKVFDFHVFLPTLDKINTRYDESYTLDIETLFLPTLRGYGKIADLHIAASQNPVLKEKLIALCQIPPEKIFSMSYPNLQKQVADILYMSAGVDQIDPTSRGPHVDARTMHYLEKYLNRNYENYKWDNNPHESGGIMMRKAWAVILNKSTSTLFVQCGAKLLFEPNLEYDIFKDKVEISESLATPETYAAIEALLLNKSEADKEMFWTIMESFLKGLEDNEGKVKSVLNALKTKPASPADTSSPIVVTP